MVQDWTKPVQSAYKRFWGPVQSFHSCVSLSRFSLSRSSLKRLPLLLTGLWMKLAGEDEDRPESSWFRRDLHPNRRNLQIPTRLTLHWFKHNETLIDSIFPSKHESKARNHIWALKRCRSKKNLTVFELLLDFKTFCWKLSWTSPIYIVPLIKHTHAPSLMS